MDEHNTTNKLLFIFNGIYHSLSYMGHIVDEVLSDNFDIEQERRALAVRGNMLAHRFARCTVGVKLTLFKA
jgi:hypothetical protein